jgi:hypothetical protein
LGVLRGGRSPRPDLLRRFGAIVNDDFVRSPVSPTCGGTSQIRAGHRGDRSLPNGLADFLGAERKRVPGDVLRDAERLECFLFSGYDPWPYLSS